MTAVLSRSPDGRIPAAGVDRAPQAIQSRWHWGNWPVVVKLAAVLFVPTIVALVAGILRIVDQAGAAPGYARITQIVHLQQQLSDLIGSVAKERDLATVFVATGRAADRRALDAQFRAVDGNVRVVTGAVGQVKGLDFARAPIAELDGLAPLRASVTTGFSPVEVVITEYSDAIDPLLELDSALTRQLDNVAVTNTAAAAHALLAGSEQISRQHAIVLAALYANRLGPGQIEDLRAAIVRLATEQNVVRGTLAPAERADVTAGIGPDAELSRQRVLQLVLDRGLAGQPLNTPPQDWNQRNVVVLDNIANVERGLRQRMEQTARGLLDRVRTEAGLNAVILFFALGLGVLIGIFVTRALLRPLGVLKCTALDIADRRLPEAMARIRDGGAPETAIEPVPVGTREEIGQVARAFDEVHSQAVRLASEQAQLRSNINDIFVNLSRRTQGLVERQLKLIDRLESGEQDPQQLDNLFQLDHLATRMRRNSENLLVLAGTDATNRSGRPVRLIDVLRAAASEVEQYQRLVLQQPPAILVLGRSASDLVHLLAELLDNATQFSPPESHVMISTDLAEDGGVVIEVADRGVGMTEEELAEANQRLATPAVVDASVSRRMGLFVVGRLASRHGITVQLRRGEADVGIWASVVMPSRLVRVAVEPVEPVEAPDQKSADSKVTATAVPPTAVPPTNGSVTTGSVQSLLAAGLGASRNGVPVPRPHIESAVDAPVVKLDAAGEQPAEGGKSPGHLTDASEAGASEAGASEAGASEAGASEAGASEAGASEAGASEAGASEAGSELNDSDETGAGQAGDDGTQPAMSNPTVGSALPQRKGNRATPAEPPPAPPGPPTSPPVADSVQVPEGSAGADLFRPARSSVAGPGGPGHRVTLQHSTPIFDDVASAWFKEHEAVPVRWTVPLAPGTAGPPREVPTRQVPSPDAPLPDAPAADATPVETAPVDAAVDVTASGAVPVTAPAPAGPPPLVRRQPGRTLAESGSGTAGSSTAGKPGRSGLPVASLETSRPTSVPDWGAGDEGWRAAQALSQAVDAEVTAVGLPRRQPRALLVPGAAGAAESTSAPPVRSAEAVRGRLASYQQGIREGRQARANFEHNAGGGSQHEHQEQQDGEEGTT